MAAVPASPATRPRPTSAATSPRRIGSCAPLYSILAMFPRSPARTTVADLPPPPLAEHVGAVAAIVDVRPGTR